MQNIRKFRRLLAVMLLCTGLSGLASVNTPALGASISSTLPASSSSTSVASTALAYALGYLLGVYLAAQSPATDTVKDGGEMQLATPQYQAHDFSSFD